jgi:hypothetical protein
VPAQENGKAVSSELTIARAQPQKHAEEHTHWRAAQRTSRGC